MSRLADAFTKRPGIIGYIMAGDPSCTVEHARAVMREVDVLEIGIPFSDPVADGPVIERAAVRALAHGARIEDALQLARTLRAGDPTKPLVFMTYYNPILQRGLERFARDCRDAGIDGIILPDVPLEESEAPGAALAKEGIDLIQLASPATGPERMARLAKATRGFLYLVSSFGITGTRDALAPETLEVVARAKAACAGVTPFAVGFGVSRPEHVRALSDANAIVVGSAIVGRIERGETPDQVGAFVRSLRG